MMRDQTVHLRHGAGLLLSIGVVSIPLGVDAAPTIHSAEVLGADSYYCNYCHMDPDVPYPSGPIVWHGEEQATLCLSCHNPTGMAAAKSDVALHRVNDGALIIDCSSCHDPHGTDETYWQYSTTWSVDPHPGGVTAPNLDHIRAGTTSYLRDVLGVQKLEPTVFQQRPDHFAFDEANAPWNGVCQTCHQNVAHHTNNANADHTHNQGLVCTECHPHEEGFLPHGAGDCSYCHNVPRGDNGDGTFRRRQIFDAGGDFVQTSHHVKSDVQASDCAACHYLQDHARGVVKLQDQDDPDLHYDYDPANPASVEPFCLSCHDSDGATIGGGTQPFSDGATVPVVKDAAGGEWASSAHKTRSWASNGGSPLTCLGDGAGGGCHSNGHASQNEELLSLADGAPVNQLCYNCHTDGGVINDAISGSALASSIESAFNSSAVHDLETSFQGGSYSFSLQCTTCHNPHVVTGRYTDAAANQSPVTRPDFSRSPVDNPRAMGSVLWGATAGEKAADYAGSGTYRTPRGDTFSGTQLPDYNSMCLDCHGVGAMPTPSAPSPDAHGGINWATDPHGNRSANVPNGGNAVPDWYSAGKAKGWNGDDCIGAETDCWPVVTRGKGEQVWTRPPFNQEERIAGANFVLQCVDCHEAHGSNNSSMVRTNPNGGTGTWIWNTMCNNCHYYYSDWHAGMSCGNASCHVSNGEDRMYWTGTNSLHQMGHNTGSGAVRGFDPTLVADLRFENNLNDSGDWRLHSRWFDTAGSYAAGHSGRAVVLDGDQPIELGTRNSFWSTDEGRHGTWKYTEMKYHTTLEAWVYPSDDANNEYIVFTKHVGYGQGGYQLSLQNRDNGLGLVFHVNVDGTGAGVRGAYSSVPVALNQWSHVAATFDTNGPDRSATDPTVGRIRLYINGEDVTTSDTSGPLAQPGAGEVNIFPYSDHSPANQSICYNGTWCASAFSVGGIMWGAGARRGFVGMLDEAKVWNITQPASYFQPIDATTGPRILTVSGTVGSTRLVVTFSEGVYGSSGALQVSDFSYIDVDDGRTIVAVDHVAGSNTATLTLSGPLDDSDDIGVDIVQVDGADEYGNPAEASIVTVIFGGGCPTGQAAFNLNEAAGSPNVVDDQGFIVGVVNNAAAALPGDGTLHGDGAASYIAFNNNTSCLIASRAMTVEARIKPTGIADAVYIRRILARDTGGNFQLSVWRGNPAVFPAFTPPTGVASIAFWLKPVDAHGGKAWKPVLTDYSAFPIVSDHWYQVRAVWNSDKVGGVVNQPYLQADIFIDDEGTDGLGTGENWAGYRNATDDTQGYLDAARLSYTGDEISTASGVFSIGVNTNNHGGNLFSGQIDWVIWEGIADYTGVDDPPN